MEPLTEVHLLGGLDFLNYQPAFLGHRTDVNEVDLFALGRAEETLDNRSGDRVAGQLGGQTSLGDRESLGTDLPKLGQQHTHFFAEA